MVIKTAMGLLIKNFTIRGFEYLVDGCQLIVVGSGQEIEKNLKLKTHTKPVRTIFIFLI